MDDFDLLANDDVPEVRKEREDGRERRLAVHSPEGHIVDFEAVGEIANTRASRILVCYDDDFMPSINELLPYPLVFGRAKRRIGLTLDSWYM